MEASAGSADSTRSVVKIESMEAPPPPRPHPLRKWMSKADFDLVCPYIRCSESTDLSKLFQEPHVEIDLGMQLSYSNGACYDERDEEDSYDSYGEDSLVSAASEATEETVHTNKTTDSFFDEKEPNECLYTFAFHGKTTGTHVGFSIRADQGKKARTLRNLLLSRLASQCKAPKRLSVTGSTRILNGMYSSRPYTEDVKDVNAEIADYIDEDQSWCNLREILSAFSIAGHWIKTLERLDVLSVGAGWEILKVDVHHPFLPTTPERLTHIHLQDIRGTYSLKGFLNYFPALETFVVKRCSGISLSGFFRGLEQSTPHLVNIECAGDFLRYPETPESLSGMLQVLRSLPQLKRLIIGHHSCGSDKVGEQRSRAEEIVHILPETSIEEIGIGLLGGQVLSNASFDALCSYLLQESCRLVRFDLNWGSNKKRAERIVGILSKTSLLQKVYVPLRDHHLLKSLDYLLAMRRFREELSLNDQAAAALWPSLLVTDGISKRTKHLSERTIWFFSPSALACSVIYTLLREKVGMFCDRLESNRAMDTASGKRALLVEATTTGHSKRPKEGI